jgi:hypothetical protein
MTLAIVNVVLTGGDGVLRAVSLECARPDRSARQGQSIEQRVRGEASR